MADNQNMIEDLKNQNELLLKTRNNYKSIKKLQSETQKTQEKINNLSESDVEYTDKLNKLKNELSKNQEKINQYQKENSGILKEVNKEYKNSVESMKQEAELHNSISEQLTTKSQQTSFVRNIENDIFKRKLDTLALERIQLDAIEKKKNYDDDIHNNIDKSVSMNSELNKLQEQQLKGANDLLNYDSSMFDVSEQKKAIQEQMQEVSSQIEKANEEGLNRKKEELQFVEKILQKEMATTKTIQNSNKVLAEKQNILNRQNKKVDNFIDLIEKGLGNIPIIGGLFNSLDFDSIRKKSKASIQDGIHGDLKGVNKGAKTAFGALAKGFKDAEINVLGFGIKLSKVNVLLGATTVALGVLTNMTLSYNNAQAETAKAMGITVDQSNKLFVSTAKVSESINEIGITTKELTKSMVELQASFGGVTITNARLLEDTTRLREELGIATENAMNLELIALQTGKNAGELANEVTNVTLSMEEQLGTSINLRSIMKDVSEIPPSITVAFKGSTEQLIRAVQKSKMLGMELSKVRDIGKGMLDIESSLKDEMEARVLTGRNLNLDMARQFAITGNISALQDELLKQAGSLSDFKEMDVIQQESFAKAMNMSVDEMTKLLSKAELNKKLGFDLQKISEDELEAKLRNNEITDEALKKQAEQEMRNRRALSLSETLGKIWEKFKDVLAIALAGPLGEFSNYLSLLLQDSDGLKNIFSNVGGILKGIVKGAMTLIPIFKGIFKVGEFLLPLFLPIIGVITGIARLLAGDITGGIYDIGAAIIGQLLGPIKIFGKIFGKIFENFPSIGKMFGKITGMFSKMKKAVVGFFSNIFGKIKEIPIIGSLIGMVTGSGDSSNSDQPNENIINNEYKTSKINDTVNNVTNNQNATESNSTKDLNNKLDKMIQLMTEMVSMNSQPAQLRLGNRVVSEMSELIRQKKDNTSGLDNTYGVNVSY